MGDYYVTISIDAMGLTDNQKQAIRRILKESIPKIKNQKHVINANVGTVYTMEKFYK